MAIDRCYCREVMFTRLKNLAAQHGAGVERLSALTGAGTGCGLCVPYIRVMLATGRTELPVLSDVEVRRLCTPASGSGGNKPGLELEKNEEDGTGALL